MQDGFAILKVGPGLTFALREGLYGLDGIAEELFPGKRDQTLRASMETDHAGRAGKLGQVLRGQRCRARTTAAFPYSDRMRYYGYSGRLDAAVELLFEVLGDIELPGDFDRPVSRGAL